MNWLTFIAAFGIPAIVMAPLFFVGLLKTLRKQGSFDRFRTRRRQFDRKRFLARQRARFRWEPVVRRVAIGAGLLALFVTSAIWIVESDVFDNMKHQQTFERYLKGGMFLTVMLATFLLILKPILGPYLASVQGPRFARGSPRFSPAKVRQELEESWQNFILLPGRMKSTVLVRLSAATVLVSGVCGVLSLVWGGLLAAMLF